MEKIPEQEKSKDVHPLVTVLCWIAFFLVWFIIIGVQAASVAL